jgi:HEAT repeat protein
MAWFTSFLLKSSNPQLRCKAIATLADSGRTRDTELIFASLTDKDPKVRCAAVRALEKRNNEDSVPSLIGALSDSNYEVRQAAARALGRLKDSSAIEPLTAALRDSDPAVRTAAAVALRALAWRPSTRDELARFEIALGNTPSSSLGDAAIDPLVSELTNETAFYRRAAAEALRELNDPRKVGPLLEALRDHDFSVRISAVHSLQHVVSEQVTGEILKLFRDSDNHVRLAAAQVVARRQDAAPAHFLGLLEDQNFEIRLVAVQFLGKIRSPHIAEILMARLSDSDVDIRQETASALGMMGNPAAIEPLVLCLADEDRLVRRGALRSLEQLDAAWFQSPAAVNMRPQLEALLAERSEWVRSDIQDVLAKLCPPEPSIDNVDLHMAALPVDLPSSASASATTASNY